MHILITNNFIVADMRRDQADLSELKLYSIHYTIFFCHTQASLTLSKTLIIINFIKSTKEGATL
jgi:hypothetical protein